MTIIIKHPFVSAKGDGGDATLVRPSNWNATHSTSMSSGQLVGRLTAGVGAFEEIPISAYMAGLLGAADAATLAGLLGLFETGDVKYTFKSTASAGWLLLPGSPSLTIGSAASAATLRANADTLALYTLLWNNVTDAWAPVTGGRGASAAADFSANKQLRVPNLVGVSPMGAGAATFSWSARTLGQSYGEENHVLTVAEMPPHRHQVFLTDPGHTHSVVVAGVLNGGAVLVGGGGSFFQPTSQSYTTAAAVTGISVSDGVGNLNVVSLIGSGTSHNTIHPVTALNAMVKL